MRFHYRTAALAAAVVFSITSLAACDNHQERQSAYFAKAKSLFESGAYDRARLEFKNVLQIDPKHAESWYLLGRIEEHAGELRPAFQHYVNAVELAPDLTGARVRKAQLLILGGKLEQAAEEIDLALTGSPEEPDALTARGVLAQRQGRLADARADALAALQIDPAHSAANLLLATLQLREQAFAEAVATLEKGISLAERTDALRLMLAHAHQTAGNHADAVTALEALVDDRAGNFRYRQRLADYHLNLKQPEQAERVLREGLRLRPDDEARRVALIRFLVKTRGIPEARTELAAWIRDDDADAVRWRLADAELLRLEGDRKAAEKIYRQVLAQDAESVRHHALAGKALTQLLAETGRVEEALQVINRTLDGSPNDTDALQLRATLTFQSNDPDQTVADLRRVLRDDPNRLAAQRLIGRAHAKLGAVSLARDAFERAIALDPEDPVAYLQLAELGYRSGDVQAARQTLGRLSHKLPKHLNGHLAAARLQIKVGDWDGLEKTADAVRALDPDHPYGRYLDALSLQRRHEHVAAIAAFDEALPGLNGLVEAQIALVRSQIALHQWDPAEARLRGLLSDRSADAELLGLLGQVLVGKGEYEEAEQQYRAALDAAPQSAAAYERLAALQSHEGRVDSAIATLETGLATAKTNARLRLLLASLLEVDGQYGRAEDLYRQLLSDNPGLYIAANNLAALLVSQRGDAEALDQALEAAGRLSTSDVPEFLDTLGWVHYRRQEFEQAMPYLQKAAEARPQSAEIRYHLGMTYMSMGRADEAEPHLRTAAASPSGFEGQEEAKRLLDELSEAG